MVLKIRAEKINGSCPVYEEDDIIVLDGAKVKGKVCLHALSAITSLVVPLRDGIAPSCYGIGDEKVGYLQCPDPGPPYTKGGTVIFRLEYVKKPLRKKSQK